MSVALLFAPLIIIYFIQFFVNDDDDDDDDDDDLILSFISFQYMLYMYLFNTRGVARLLLMWTPKTRQGVSGPP